MSLAIPPVCQVQSVAASWCTPLAEAFDAFIENFQVKYDKAAECLEKDREAQERHSTEALRQKPATELTMAFPIVTPQKMEATCEVTSRWEDVSHDVAI